MSRFFTLDRLFLATVLAGHGLLVAWAWLQEDPVADLSQEFLPFVQVTLLTLWILTGPGHWGIRLLGILLVAGCLWGWSHVTRYWPGQEVFPLGLWVIATAAIAGLALRLAGLRVLRPNPVSPDENRPMQFSIRSLLVATTICSLLLMSAKWVHATVNIEGGESLYDFVELSPHLARGTLAAGLVAVSLMALAAVLGTRCTWLSSLLLLPLAAGVGAGLALVLHRHEHWVSLSLWMVAQGLLVAGSLAPLRNLGYRFRRITSPSSGARLARAPIAEPFKVNHESVSATP
ncbi:MAG: hypothetical protein ACR2FY_21315 [Pirellulaceae bacterium]